MTKALEDGNLDALVDPRLGYEYNNNEMEKMIACAAACVRHFARRRPRMSQVHKILFANASSLPSCVQHCWHCCMMQIISTMSLPLPPSEFWLAQLVN
jgi:hypothetical protein